MAYGGTDAETLLIRTSVISVALQALIGRLIADGTLDKGDLVAMREVGMELAADLRASGVVAGELMSREVEAWWSAAESLSGL